MRFLFLSWLIATILTAILFVAMTIDICHRITAYYKNLGIKTLTKKMSFGEKISDLIGTIIIVICPILNFAYLLAFVFVYDEICQKAVRDYIVKYKKEELELLKEKEHEGKY